MKKILWQPWGGLGDNLQFSTLPEKFSQLGYEVYISNKNAYRNSEIIDLVWKLNPYVKGISNEQFNIGDTSTYRRIHSGKSIIYNQEACHGIEPENEIPKIYYKPKKINEFKDVVFVDLSAKSSIPVKPEDCKIVVPSFSNKVDNHKDVDFQYDNKIDIQSIFHFCDLIHSCKYFYCSFSGQAVLSSAIDKKNTTVFIRKEWKNIDWCFPNLNYEVVI
jgi:hypothetical protein